MIPWEETGECTVENHRGKGPDTQGKICGDNTGKVQYAAGTGDNLQRPVAEVRAEGEGRVHGLAHESIRAKKEKQRSLSKGTLGTWRFRKRGDFWTQGQGAVDSGTERDRRRTGYGRSGCEPALKLQTNSGRPTEESQGQNRTWENRPSGIERGLWETQAMGELGTHTMIERVDSGNSLPKVLCIQFYPTEKIGLYCKAEKA
jgi:hypothetical protein